MCPITVAGGSSFPSKSNQQWGDQSTNNNITAERPTFLLLASLLWTWEKVYGMYRAFDSFMQRAWLELNSLRGNYFCFLLHLRTASQNDLLTTLPTVCRNWMFLRGLLKLASSMFPLAKYFRSIPQAVLRAAEAPEPFVTQCSLHAVWFRWRICLLCVKGWYQAMWGHFLTPILRHLRGRPECTVCSKDGWRWRPNNHPTPLISNLSWHLGSARWRFKTLRLLCFTLSEIKWRTSS